MTRNAGKARFPTIPVFTYGEQLDISIAEPPIGDRPIRSLNYTFVSHVLPLLIAFT